MREHATHRKGMQVITEAEARTSAVASVLAALVVGRLERDERLDLEVARLAESAHRAVLLAGRAA